VYYYSSRAFQRYQKLRMNQHHLGHLEVTKKRKEKKLPSFIDRYTKYLLVMKIELWYP
jgi:hypothetical protein